MVYLDFHPVSPLFTHFFCSFSPAEKNANFFWPSLMGSEKEIAKIKYFLPILDAVAKILLVINSKHSTQKIRNPRIFRICTVRAAGPECCPFAGSFTSLVATKLGFACGKVFHGITQATIKKDSRSTGSLINRAAGYLLQVPLLEQLRFVRLILMTHSEQIVAYVADVGCRSRAPDSNPGLQATVVGRTTAVDW